MGIFDWFLNWKQKREEKKTQAAIKHLDVILEGEVKEISDLRILLSQISVEKDPAKRVALYLRFEKELKAFEDAVRVVESLDKGILRGTMFKSLKKN